MTSFYIEDGFSGFGRSSSLGSSEIPYTFRKSVSVFRFDDNGVGSLQPQSPDIFQYLDSNTLPSSIIPRSSSGSNLNFKDQFFREPSIGPIRKSSLRESSIELNFSTYKFLAEPSHENDQNPLPTAVSSLPTIHHPNYSFATEANLNHGYQVPLSPTTVEPIPYISSSSRGKSIGRDHVQASRYLAKCSTPIQASTYLDIQLADNSGTFQEFPSNSLDIWDRNLVNFDQAAPSDIRFPYFPAQYQYPLQLPVYPTSLNIFDSPSAHRSVSVNTQRNQCSSFRSDFPTPSNAELDIIDLNTPTPSYSDVSLGSSHMRRTVDLVSSQPSYFLPMTPDTSGSKNMKLSSTTVKVQRSYCRTSPDATPSLFRVPSSSRSRSSSFGLSDSRECQEEYPSSPSLMSKSKASLGVQRQPKQKAKITLAEMIANVIKESDGQCLRLADIYKNIMGKYADELKQKPNIRNTIRHTLSIYPCFQNLKGVGKRNGENGSPWRVVSDVIKSSRTTKTPKKVFKRKFIKNSTYEEEINSDYDDGSDCSF